MEASNSKRGLNRIEYLLLYLFLSNRQYDDGDYFIDVILTYYFYKINDILRDWFVTTYFRIT